jgi:hypothetical protein
MEMKWNKISTSESTNYFVLLMTKEIYELDEEEEYIGVKKFICRNWCSAFVDLFFYTFCLIVLVVILLIWLIRLSERIRTPQIQNTQLNNYFISTDQLQDTFAFKVCTQSLNKNFTTNDIPTINECEINKNKCLNIFPEKLLNPKFACFSIYELYNSSLIQREFRAGAFIKLDISINVNNSLDFKEKYSTFEVFHNVETPSNLCRNNYSDQMSRFGGQPVIQDCQDYSLDKIVSVPENEIFLNPNQYTRAIIQNMEIENIESHTWWAEIFQLFDRTVGWGRRTTDTKFNSRISQSSFALSSGEAFQCRNNTCTSQMIVKMQVGIENQNIRTSTILWHYNTDMLAESVLFTRFFFNLIGLIWVFQILGSKIQLCFNCFCCCVNPRCFQCDNKCMITDEGFEYFCSKQCQRKYFKCSTSDCNEKILHPPINLHWNWLSEWIFQILESLYCCRCRKGLKYMFCLRKKKRYCSFHEGGNLERRELLEK